MHQIYKTPTHHQQICIGDKMKQTSLTIYTGQHLQLMVTNPSPSYFRSVHAAQRDIV